MVVRADVTTTPVSAEEHESLVRNDAAGAVVSFVGVVRDHDRGKSVELIEYVAHPSASTVIAEIVEKLAADADILGLAVSHRVGTLQIGDVALACAVSSAHRAEAFEICARIVDEVKAALPIWKRQVFTDGTEEWVACP